MEDFAALHDGSPSSRKQWFETALEARPREQLLLAAARAALRVLPIFGQRFSLNGSFGAQLLADGPLLLSYFRSLAVAAPGATAPESEPLRAAAAQASTSATARTSALLSQNTSLSGNPRSAFDAARSAVRIIVSAGPQRQEAAAAIEAAYFAVLHSFDPAIRDLNSQGNPSASQLAEHTKNQTLFVADDFVTAFLADLAAFDRGIALSTVASSPLFQWPHGFVKTIGPPTSNLTMLLEQLGGDWSIWADWYRGIARGDSNGTWLFGLPTERALGLWRDIALIPDEIWKADPAVVNAEIKRLVKVARGEQHTGRPAKEIPNAPENKRPEKKVGRPKSAVGKAMVANAAPIALQTALLVPLIEREIERIKAMPPNSEEAIAAQTEHIQKLEKLKTDTLELQKAALNLANEKASEKDVLKKADAFFKPFRDCLNKDGESFVRACISSGIFLAAISIAHLLGMALHPLITTTVLGAIAAEKPLVNVLKSAKGMFKFGS